MAIKWTNNASTTLASSISASTTTITVASSGGALFPTLGAGDYFYATLVDSSNNLEIVKVTARVGDVMTVVRGQEGTSAHSYVGGDKFELRPTAAGFASAAAGENIVALPISQGGTGAGNAADARANLDVVQDPGANGIMVRTADGASTARSIAAGSGISVSNGSGVSADPTVTNTGVLALTAGSGISISVGQDNKTITNAGVKSFNGTTGDVTFTADPPVVQVFTSSGTWTKQSGLKAVLVEVVGGGGGGGARYVSGKTTNVGGNGGGGGYSRKVITAASLGSTETVTVGAGGTAQTSGTATTNGGAGGTSSFGSHVTATGGAGGVAGKSSGSGSSGAGGTGTSTFSNTPPEGVNFDGQDGNYSGGGPAGESARAFGLGGTAQAATVASHTGGLYGGGGYSSSSATAQNAGPGAAGIVIVTNFF